MWKDDDLEEEEAPGEDSNEEEMNLSKRSALSATIDHIALDDDDEERHDRLLSVRATQTAALGNANAVRAEERVIDNTAYYNLVSLLTSVYIRTKEGFALPIIFDARTQHMIHNKRIRFDF